MFVVITAFTILFLILMFYEDDNIKSIIFGAVTSFLGFGAYALSYDGTNYKYSFVPLVFVVISILWSIYKIYLIIQEANKKDWGDTAKNSFKEESY